MPPHPLTNFEIQKYYQNESRFNGAFSRDNLPKKIKDGAWVINLYEYADVGTHSIALFCNRSEIVCFDNFDVEHVPEEIKEFATNKNIIADIFRVQANNSVMCGYSWIGFIDFMLAGKKLTDFTNMSSPYNNIILSYFKDKWNWQNKLSEKTKFWLSEKIRIENYFPQEIQRKLCSKKLSKCVTAFDYIYKISIVLSARSSGVSIITKYNKKQKEKALFWLKGNSIALKLLYPKHWLTWK